MTVKYNLGIIVYQNLKSVFTRVIMNRSVKSASTV